MKRRSFVTSFAAACMVPGLARAYPSVPYAPETWSDVRADADRMILNFRASWSITCQIKHDLITSLIRTNPAYGRLTFVDVDWDTFGPSEWVEKRLKVERRSTLIAMKDGKEVGRLVNEPYEARIRSFLDTALAA